MTAADDLAGGDIERGEQRGRAVSNVIVGCCAGIPGRIGSTDACDPRPGLALLVEAEHDAHGRAGADRAPRCRGLLDKCGSADNLNVSTRCDCKPNVCQMREMWPSTRPAASAIERVLHCVAERRAEPRDVRVMTRRRDRRSTRGAPGRGSSVRPRSDGPETAHATCRHCCSNVQAAGDRRWSAPQRKPARGASRRARRCAVVGRRAHCSNVRRSSSVSSNGLL